jgi:pyruvate kinase
MERRTKIIATIGPASESEQTLTKLIQAGMNVARLNFSHGSYPDHAIRIERIRRLSHELSRPIAILQDLQGPKIRTGILARESVQLIKGQTLTLTTQPVVGDANLVSVDYPALSRSVKPGNRILLDDGQLELSVVHVRPDQVETRVVLGGELKAHKGVNLPGAQLDLPGFTQKDEEDLEFGLQQGVDGVAISFVRLPQDVITVREAIARLAPDRTWTPIIAKLERPEALDNLEDIILSADGVMVARGDLGVEMSPESVPIAQKEIIEKANCHARLVITATQMLDSMIHNPRPTRAEASDVANAIFDGSDAVMLSGETAAGQYPVESVEMMHAITCQAESHLAEWGHWKGTCTPESSQDDAYFLTLAARELAQDRNVAAIAVFTQSGRTALLMSKTRPGVPILAFTPNLETYQRLSFYWGVYPHLVPHVDTIEDMLKEVEAAMIASTPILAGEQVVVICGFPVRNIRPTNLALLYTVGETL